ncbi:hypothetical protein ABT279_16735 [Amycolatopsis sp. NPDC000673]
MAMILLSCLAALHICAKSKRTLRLAVFGFRLESSPDNNQRDKAQKS